MLLESLTLGRRQVVVQIVGNYALAALVVGVFQSLFAYRYKLALVIGGAGGFCIPRSGPSCR